MKLIVKNYEIEEVELTDVCVEKYGTIEYLQIRLFFDSCYQNYPACKINDLTSGINSFKDCFDIKTIEQGNGKKCLAILSQSDVLALVNPLTNKIFSLQAQYFPEKYKDDIYEFKSQPGNEFLSRLPDKESLLLGFMKNIKPKNEHLALHIHNIINSYAISQILEQNLTHKTEKLKPKTKL